MLHKLSSPKETCSHAGAYRTATYSNQQPKLAFGRRQGVVFQTHMNDEPEGHRDRAVLKVR